MCCPSRPDPYPLVILYCSLQLEVLKVGIVGGSAVYLSVVRYPGDVKCLWSDGEVMENGDCCITDADFSLTV